MCFSVKKVWLEWYRGPNNTKVCSTYVDCAGVGANHACQLECRATFPEPNVHSAPNAITHLYLLAWSLIVGSLLMQHLIAYPGPTSYVLHRMVSPKQKSCLSNTSQIHVCYVPSLIYIARSLQYPRCTDYWQSTLLQVAVLSTEFFCHSCQTFCSQILFLQLQIHVDPNLLDSGIIYRHCLLLPRDYTLLKIHLHFTDLHLAQYA